MDVRIYYCKTCGFKKHADAVAAVLSNEFGIQPQLEEGFWGTFRVLHSDREVFNRRKTRGLLGRLGFGRIPPTTEIIDMLRETLDAASVPGNPPGVLED